MAIACPPEEGYGRQRKEGAALGKGTASRGLLAEEKKGRHGGRGRHRRTCSPEERDVAGEPARWRKDVGDDRCRVRARVLPALLSLWDPASHAFRLPAGAATFSLEDALLLAGLPPSGAPLDRPLTPEEEDLQIRLLVEKEKIRELHPCARDARHVSAEVWLEWFDSSIRPGEDDELRRLGFIAYWLAFFVTPRLQPRSGELPDCAFALAARLSLGERIALGPAMVANLYADMDRIVTSGVMEGFSGRVDTWGPLLLLQVWIWERFDRLRPPPLKAPPFPVSNARVHLWSRRKRTTTQEEAQRVFQDEACFLWRPYQHNLPNWRQPEWFNDTTTSVCSKSRNKPKWLKDYSVIISQAVLTGRYGDGIVNSVMYNPHLVSRQFGYDQDYPISTIHDSDSNGIEVLIPSIGRHGVASKDYVAWWNARFERHQETNQYDCRMMANKENDMSTWPRSADLITVVQMAVDKFRKGTKQENSKCITKGQLPQLGNVAPDNKSKTIVLGLSAFDFDCSQNTVKRKDDIKKVRFKSANVKRRKKNKKNKVSANECGEGPQFYDWVPLTVSDTENNSLQLEVQECSAPQEDSYFSSKRCDELSQLDNDECIVLEPPPKNCEVINLDDDEEHSVPDPKHHDRQLVLELEQFVRSGLLSQREESSDEDEEDGRNREILKDSKYDPFSEAARREYPLFFEFIPQKPHYRGLLNNDEALGDLACSGLWFLLVGLAKEVLDTSCDTDASEIVCLMKKAQELEQLGFNVKHFIARLKEPQSRLRMLQASIARLEDARKKEQEANRLQSLSSHLSKLKHNIRTMERHLDENNQASSSSIFSLEKEVEAAEKYCQAMKDEVIALKMSHSNL
uniref:Aminotransferase-like plant mobile domain-containing protein n=1 Tax=Oryza brachyantha TaxID=4533 RepID=J3N1H5_ORYBR